MSVMKVVEILSESDVSWEDAAKQAVSRAARTLHNIKSIYIKEQSAKVDNGKIVSYRVNAKISFQLDNTIAEL
jgi:flavin-binding protein dodecin